MRPGRGGRWPCAARSVIAAQSIACICLGLWIGVATGRAEGAAAFETARVRFERNATDGDVEVVFEVKGGDEGLATLRVVSPDGRTVVDFRAPDASTLGIRQFHLESPEPRDVAALKSAYPQGVYRFSGANGGAETLHGEATLSHELPATVAFLHPGPDAEGVDARNLEIRWTPVENLASTILEIEQDELGVKLKAELPGSVASFPVPDGILQPGTEYQLGIGSVARGGNISVVETTFTTAGSSE